MPITMGDLKKQSIQALASRMGAVRVLIADNDAKIAGLVRSVLTTIGIQHIEVVADGSAALHYLSEHPVDLLITDWQMRPMDGIDLVRHLRSAADSPNKLLPIIMMTARAERMDVETARDVGITEYVIKPFTAQTLMTKLVAIIENPRSFILTEPYVGPNRRRKMADMSGERRTRKNNEGCLIITKSQLSNIELGSIPFIIQPDFELKKKIGVNIDCHDLLLPECLAPAEKVIGNTQRDFLQWISQDLTTLQTDVTRLTDNRELAAEIIPQIRTIAYTIKSRAGTFGYSRGTEVAQLLYDFCTETWRPDNEHHAIVLQKHIDTLYVIFSQHIMGDGGKVGADLVSDLSRLIKKYSQH